MECWKQRRGKGINRRGKGINRSKKEGNKEIKTEEEICLDMIT